MSTAKPQGSPDPLATLRIDRSQYARPLRSSPRRSWLWMVIIVLLAGGAGVYWAVRNGMIPTDLSWLSVPEALQSAPQVRVEIVTVQYGRSGDATVVATGYLESRRQAKIGARAAGRIEGVFVEEGSKVEQGQVLAVLEHSDMDAALAAMQASLARASAALAEQEITIAQNKRDFDRARQLYGNRTVSDAEYEQTKFTYDSAVARRDSMKADVKLAEARVRESEQFRENMFIRAPFSGTVISKDAEVGESILPGGMGEASGRGSAVTIADLEHLEVDCDVKEGYISRVTEGQQAEVAVDAVPNRRYHGRVRKIIPMGDRTRATIKVKVEIVDVDDRLFPDMSSTVFFLPSETSAVEDDKPRVFCPSSAVMGSDQELYVWKVDAENRVTRVNIEALEAKDGKREIVKGLSGREKVVVGTQDLSEGQKIKPQ